MHKIELKIDDEIFDKFMGLLEILPKDKLEVCSVTENFVEVIEEVEEVENVYVSEYEAKINMLLKEEKLSHFKFFEDGCRIVYTHESGTPRHMEDFHKLILILKEHHIKHSDIGIDVLMLDKD